MGSIIGRETPYAFGEKVVLQAHRDLTFTRIEVQFLLSCGAAVSRLV